MNELAEFLAEEIEWTDDVGNTCTSPRGERIADLMIRNGGPDVYGWGILRGIGPGSGLLQPDALELLQHTAFLKGIEFAGGDTSAFDSYLEHVGSRYMAEPSED